MGVTTYDNSFKNSNKFQNNWLMMHNHFSNINLSDLYVQKSHTLVYITIATVP